MDKVDKKLTYLARNIVDSDSVGFEGGNYVGFENSITDLTHYYIQREAYQNMLNNCDKNHIAYARVPTGRETCAFCFMLASRGFVYKNEESASAVKRGKHIHCDCVVVPGEKGSTHIDGYDPDALSDRYDQCIKTLGGGGGLQEKWDDLPDEVRTALEERHPGNARGMWERKLILAEINTRDYGWLYSGREPQIIYEKPESALLPHERIGVEMLQKNGISITVKKEDPKAKSNIDFLIGHNLYELKNISNKRSSLGNQMSRCRAKWYKAKIKTPVRGVLTCEGCKDNFEEVCSGVLSRIQRKEEFVIFSETGEMRRISTI